MRLLLTNDDGINAEGLHILAMELEKQHQVVIAAPNMQRSACGHSITIDRPLVIKEVEIKELKSKCYSIDGTPADCVRISIDKLTDEKFDMVVSGINRGVNLGTDVIYSGTVSAAIEAAIYKIPSIAVSSEINKDRHNYELAARTVAEIISKSEQNLTAKDIVLNINVPLYDEREVKGIKVCRIGNRTYTNTYIEKLDNEGNKSYEILGSVNESNEEDADVDYFKKGFITLTPLHYDLTNFKILKEIDNWI